MIFKCESCGAEFETDSKSRNVKCPYCDRLIEATVNNVDYEKALLERDKFEHEKNIESSRRKCIGILGIFALVYWIVFILLLSGVFRR